MATATLDEIRRLSNDLSPEEKLALIEELTRDLCPRDPADGSPRRFPYGALAHLGTAPSAEEINEMRREVWANFPRDIDLMDPRPESDRERRG